MTSEIALDYIRRRMQEMGHREHYLLRLRHLLLRPGEVRELIAYGQLLVLMETSDSIRIESDVGLYDLSDDQAQEIQYEHRGYIRVINLSVSPTSVRLLQAIPQNSTNDARNE
ncbi:hypothetical protein [Flaviaesturariibacter aridisoli]|uniref:Uncharacterized protein n=1 Tax=Flaviaesturariibacter aridisoli TaxID=2545761 RepID=A0A4R4DW99_9BACT|nr:hypothetical protein [Flaviaesturariibacter aridisoli]TCZ68355.1 hypothetical protein E0486_14280 [Flaviaesturariibacter aridisoli]